MLTNPTDTSNHLTTSAHKTEVVNRTKNMRLHPFVSLPERMRTACDRSGATGKERDKEIGYGYFPHQARQTSTGHIPLLCPCQKPTISLPTPTTVGDGWAFVGPKATDDTKNRNTLQFYFAIIKKNCIFASKIATC